MLKSKNLYLYIAIFILIVFSGGYFIAVNKISYAFSYDSDVELHNVKINLIKRAAIEYAENNMDIFDKEEAVYITADDLANLGYLATDEHGKVLDPSSEVKALNDVKIRLTLKDKKIAAKIIL